MKWLYDETGAYQGCTNTPDAFADLNKTDIPAIPYDEFTEVLYFVDGAWEIRLKQENTMPMGKGQRGGKKKKRNAS